MFNLPKTFYYAQRPISFDENNISSDEHRNLHHAQLRVRPKTYLYTYIFKRPNSLDEHKISFDEH